MSESCWNCGTKGTHYLEDYANYFCDQCYSLFKEEAKKYHKESER